MKQFSLIGVAVGTALLLASCAGVDFGSGRKAEDAKSLTATPVSFAQLPGWNHDNPQQALVAFRKSCQPMMKRAPQAPVAPAAMGGTIADWKPACQAAEKTRDAAQFFQSYFQPYRLNTPLGDTGLYTGYYEAMLHGSRTRSARYNVPLYKRPPELVMVELGEFRPSLKGERVAGKVVDGKLKPYADRAAIEQGALSGRGLEIAYVDDANGAFFLHIQGSGRIAMDDGRQLRVGYDGQNGHVYYAIGRELIRRGELSPENVSLQTIRAWMEKHPQEAAALRQKNPSYIFFRELSGEGPLGAQGVALTPARSLAIDPRFVPYGAPVYIAVENPRDAQKKISRLMVAQDTGGAIRGPVRGDMFWGSGAQAEEIAGIMKSRGKAWLLLPKTLGTSTRTITLQ